MAVFGSATGAVAFNPAIRDADCLVDIKCGGDLACLTQFPSRGDHGE